MKYILQFFTFSHLPKEAQNISKPFCDLAHSMAAALPSNPETATMLRKLLEAKDCAVRSSFADVTKPFNPSAKETNAQTKDFTLQLNDLTKALKQQAKAAQEANKLFMQRDKTAQEANKLIAQQIKILEKVSEPPNTKNNPDLN